MYISIYLGLQVADFTLSVWQHRSDYKLVSSVLSIRLSDKELQYQYISGLYCFVVKLIDINVLKRFVSMEILFQILMIKLE